MTDIAYALAGGALVFWWLVGLTVGLALAFGLLAFRDRAQSRGRRRIEGRLTEFATPADALARAERKRALYQRALADLDAEGRGASRLAGEFRRKLARLDRAR